MSADGGKNWSEHGNVRLTPNDQFFGWAEPTICERADGAIVMFIRADRLGGVLYQAVSKDGGRTWPEFATVTDIPNPGSKASLFRSAVTRSRCFTIRIRKPDAPSPSGSALTG